MLPTMTGATGEYDILIAGGGLAGAPLALAFGKAGLRVALIDGLEPATATDADFDGRASAIAFASFRMLEALGVAAHLEGQTQPINDIVVSDGRLSDGAAPFFLHFDHAEIGDEPLGQMIENRHLRIAFAAELAATAMVDLIAPVTVERWQADSAWSRLTLSDGRTLAGRLAVAADGRNSLLRKAARIRSVSWSYEQSGVVATVEHARPHEGVAQEYFLPEGPFAVLPITGNRSSLVWTEPHARAKALMALDDMAFAEEMRLRFGDYLGEVAPVGPRWSYPLSFQVARTYLADRLALVGDAAHVIHPIAGQGLNLGLRDVAALAETVTDAARIGLDIGAPQVLERYQQWRRFDTLALGVVTDGLNRLFSNDIVPLRLARDLGLGMVGQAGPVRRFFMRHAGGAVGDLPRLLRGETL